MSTRGVAPVLDFADALLAGLAVDGGLYVPESWPQFGAGGRGDYVETAVEVMAPFVGDAIDPDDFAAMVADAYATFDAADVAPIVDLGGGLHLMELFHGPTLAFKDVALQLVGRLFGHELGRRGERVTIVGATSGDTGSAAIEACRDRDNVDIVVLHPADRVSEVQRRQMTTVPSANVHNVAVEGTFDDCQDLVKAMFGDTAFRDRMRLSAVNSINWARGGRRGGWGAGTVRSTSPYPPATSATCSPGTLPAWAAWRCPGWSSVPTPTTSSPASSSRAA